MSRSEKTYTFRASADLGPRMREAYATCRQLLEDDAVDDEQLADVMQRFWLSFFRRSRWEQIDNQSALLRATLELFVDATEKVAEDRRYLRRYRAWAQQDAGASAMRAGALQTATSRWRDE
jgi:hypothetical protein